MIPKPPKKREIEFNNPDFYQQKKDFNKQIREIIFKFYNLIPRSQNRDLLLKFLDCINPGKMTDITRLPYIGKSAAATSKNKLCCVFALIGWTIQTYWNFCFGKIQLLEGLNGLIENLNQIHKNGLDQYQIKGNLASGFYLEKK